jgi:hypothetical protein
MTAQVHYSQGVALRVRYHSPPNTRTPRLTVWRADATWREDPHRASVPWQDGLNGSDNAVYAVRAYLDAIPGEYADTWTRRAWFVAGASGSEWIAVPEPRWFRQATS